ncbi:hypothetical protein [Glycomyces sp. NPDC021274]|uniref:hypothetical protein n=1 Tax=Glycomyces sp. NPDC021274 TaxID=3155120 RepID=UPI0033EB12FE
MNATTRQDVPTLLGEIGRLRTELDRVASDRYRWMRRYYEEAGTYWDAELPPGGECCAECGQPVESEPCPEHNPRAVVEQLRARVVELEQARAEGDYVALPWAFLLDDEDLHEFLGDLVAVAFNRWRWDPEVPDTETLRRVEKVCTTWRLIGEAQHAHNTAPGPDMVVPAAADADTCLPVPGVAEGGVSA